MSTNASSKESLPKGLTVVYLIILLIITAAVMLIGFLAFNISSSNYGYLQSWFFPFIYVVLIMEALGRFGKRLKLNPTQYVLLFIPMFLAAGHHYILDGLYNGLATLYGWIDGASFTAFTIGGLASPGAPSWIPAYESLPSYVIPHSVADATILWNGLKPGQSIPWGTYLGPIVFWSILLVVFMLFNLALSFTITGPEWTETEKLIFPTAVPTIYLLQTATTRDESGHSLLLSTKTSQMRVFWISLAVGVIASVPAMLGAFPAYSSLSAYSNGDITLPSGFGSALMSILPGGTFSGDIAIPMAVLAILMPYDILLTIVGGWLLVPVLYNAVAIKAGWVTYVPGASFWLYGEEPPFPYQNWGFAGLSVGLGLYFIWKLRGRIAKVFKTLTGPTYYQGDFSVKIGAWMLAITTVLLYILFVAFGTTPLIALVLLAFYYIWAFAQTRILAEFWTVVPDMMSTWWQLWWPIGAGLGIWKSVPAQTNAPLTASAFLTETMGASYDTATMSPGYTMAIYKLAHDVKASIKDAFTWTAILEIIFVPVMTVLSVWLFAHIGNGNTPIAYVADSAEGMGITGFTKDWYPGDSFTGMWGWTVAGVVVIFLLMWLRSLFPWFLFSPVGLVVVLMHPDWIWPSILIGLVLKYVLSKSLGPKRTEEYVTPIASGFALGMGILYFFLALYLFFTSAWPWLIANWKP